MICKKERGDEERRGGEREERERRRLWKKSRGKREERGKGKEDKELVFKIVVSSHISREEDRGEVGGIGKVR